MKAISVKKIKGTCRSTLGVLELVSVREYWRLGKFERKRVKREIRLSPLMIVIKFDVSWASV